MIVFFSDINECDDPAIAARCVENAECCNLPAHFLCKCKPGFQGDGEAQCTGLVFFVVNRHTQIKRKKRGNLKMSNSFLFEVRMRKVLFDINAQYLL
ncbi:hypothetical protein GWI33_000523 [Rhynchophorus ferrugineus]|uniref:EGF-like domain-containing protein n=1 Tax=Rhynchophorus ferrugineus TaxID=354439 RepID=A0A834HNU4_RHYFE|nr:hypothetical protein GWI33_000523 [Rhynchophorus ferrugineus]